MMLPDKLAFVDLETTGGRMSYDRIIEVGIVRVENNHVVDTYSKLINPQTYLSPFIENMTGIYTEDLTNAPTFEEIKDEVLERIADCVFVAHNVRFDYGFLKHEFNRVGISFTSKHFCTAKLSKLLYPQYQRHNLDMVIERFGLSCLNRHRAFDDAKVLWEFYQKVQNEVSPEIFTSALSIALKKPSLPTTIAPEVFDNLPETPGVYIFYSVEGAPLYIGKSVNIKERVLSHFASDYESSREMSICSQTARIETIPTSGELGALIKESFLVKTMQPLYNKRLRHAQAMVVVKRSLSTQGYESVAIEHVHEIDTDSMETIMGVFRSKRQAKEFLRSLVKRYGLCEKYLGLEKTHSSCFSYKLGICTGACVGKERVETYNARVTKAFAGQKIQTWPFSGPVLIKENNALQQSQEGFLVDKWCMLGSMRSDTYENMEKIDSKWGFNIDTYNILLSYVRSPKNRKNIIPLSYDQLHHITTLN